MTGIVGIITVKATGVAIPVAIIGTGITINTYTGGGGGGSSYTHTQTSSSSTWTVNHNLGFRPTITVFDATGTPVNAGVTHSSLNQAIISFVTPQTGSVRCN